MERVRATHTCGPNFAWSLLAKRAEGRRFDLASLYMASIAAEPIAPSTLTYMEAVGVPRAAISPAYGMAEVVVIMCSRGSLVPCNGHVSCGRLAVSGHWGKHIIIADDAKVPSADGVVGQIYVRGPDLAAGYWRRPELTAERFHVRIGEHDDWHDTGDLGFVAKGELYVTGRAKELIIINGRNIYPTDLERLVESADARLRPGSTVAFQSTPSTAGVVLEARPEHAKMFTQDDLASWARLCAVEGSTPVDRVVLLPKGSVPKTTSGKLRRGEAARQALEEGWPKALCEWIAEANEVVLSGGDSDLPTEAALCVLWAEVLGVERVGPHDDFFELGGTSALAMILAQRTGCSVVAILAHTTIAGLMSAKSSAALVIPRALDRTRTTDAERRWVYMQMRNEFSAASNICFCVDLASNAPQFGVLRERLVDAIEATPVLHVRFDGDLALAGTSPPIHQGALDGKTPFDLFTGPVARFGIEGSKIYACVHHAVWDGRSVMNFVRRVRGELVAREDDDLDIRDYAEWEASQSVDADFWNQVLGPTSKRFDPPSSAGAGTVNKVLRVSAATVEALQRRMRQSRVSPFVLATGALHRVLRVYAPPANWNIGVAVDTRTPQMQTACGMFVNNLLIPFSDVDESFAALQKRWHGDFFPRRRDAFTTVRQLGYDCNVYNVVNTETGDPGVCFLSEDDLNELMDLRIMWDADVSGGWVVRIQSNVGEWPGFGERLSSVLRCFAGGAEVDAPRLLPGEEATLLEWGRGLSTAIPAACVHELFEAQASRTPETVALVFEGEGVSYAELARRVMVLATHLQRVGVNPGVAIGLLVERSIEMCVGIFGTLLAGGAYVPIATGYPNDRISYVLNDAGVRILLTRRRWSRSDVETCCCFEDIDFRPGSARVDLDHRQQWAKPSDTAYMIYTSGSTGMPKGVVVEHRHVVDYIVWLQKHLSWGSSDVLMQKTAYTFDDSVRELLGCFAIGARLVMLPPDAQLDHVAVLRCARANYVTILAFVPCQLDVMDRHTDWPASLRQIVASGEALGTSTVDRHLCESFELFNTYGPTETTIDSTWYKCGERNRSGAAPPIGAPTLNTTCYVVAPDGALGTPGVVGKLWIGGLGVTRGYHDRPALTAAKFVPDPFGAGGRVYKTGDLVRWNSEGELEFIGRVDHQVKVRGFRIELGEVEAALQHNEGVRGAACVVRGGSLVGYVVSAAELDAAGLKASLASALPAYMVPSVVVTLEALPLTANGKIDRMALPDPKLKHAEYVAPRSPAEAALCVVFASVLGVARVGVHDDFFALGGHSLLAMRVARETGYSVAQLLAHPSAAALAELERDADRLQHHSDSTRTTDAERRLVYLQLKEPASVAYHVPFAWTFDAGVDVHANLRRAIAATPVLSVRFTAEGEAVDGPPPVVVEGRVGALSPFDLQTGPVARFGVDCQTLTACVHHAVFDGRSVMLFLRRVADPAGAPRDAFTVRDYAEHEAARPADVGFWRGAVPEAPHFAPPVAEEGASAWRSGMRVPASLASRVRAACASRGVSSFVFVLGAVHRVLRAYASQASWAIGVAFDARPPELQHTCGMFVNTVLVPFEAAVAESIEALRDRWVGELLPRARDPYHEVVSAVGGECNVLLACNLGMGFGDAPSVGQDDETEECPLRSKFELSLSFVDDADGGWLVGAESGVGEWPRLADRVTHVVGKLAKASDDTAAVAELLLPGEETTLLEWGRGASTAVPAMCVHELFEAQAARTPEAVALVFGDAEMTYGELEGRAAALSAHLQDCMGVGPDVLVGLLVDRGFDLVVGMLGILLAGGAYMPIEPSYPEERIRFVVDDGGVALLVTQRAHRRSASDVCLDALEFKVRHAVLHRKVGPSHLAYMIYTSGSTGRPKGVEVPHKGVVNVIKERQKLYLNVGIASSLFTTSASFDAHVDETHAVLATGATIVLVKDALNLPPTVETSLLNGAPAYVSSVIDQLRSPPSLVMVGGDALSMFQRDAILKHTPLLFNAYGPTECTDECLIARVSGRNSISIGTPIANTLCYVVSSPNNTNALAPPGVAGELWIGGVGVARGYHDRPALTAAKFLPDPFGGPGGRVYKTGDLVRLNPEGELKFIGRIDYQVKVRGFRVELGEVEAALQRLEGVRGAACVVRDGSLVGYVVSAAELDASGLKTSLASSLPAYMVPTVVVGLAALPLTANGKVDRKALPEPELQHAEYVAPRTPNETALCAAFEDVLGVERVGVHDDFLALGGHSLLAVQLVNNLRKSLSPKVSIRDLLECTTPAQIAVRIKAAETGVTAAVDEWDKGMVISLRRSRGALRPS